MAVGRKDVKKNDETTVREDGRDVNDRNPEGEIKSGVTQDEVRDEPPGDIKRFEGTVAKVTTDGEVVMSDHLLPGEVTQREADERVTDDEKRAAKDARRRQAERRWHREDRDDVNRPAERNRTDQTDTDKTVKF